MTQLTETMPAPAAGETDLVAAIQRVLAASPEPLTLSKLREKLPAPFRSLGPEELTEALRRQVAANVVHQYPKYRSQQDRFWDRAMPVHVTELVRGTLREGPLPWSELRRKLPSYAVPHAEGVLQELTARGQVHRHPPLGKRGGERFGLERPDPREYLKSELGGVFRRLVQLGFTEGRLRESAMALLQEEEWSPTAEAPPESKAQPAQASAAPRESQAPPTGGPSTGQVPQQPTATPGSESRQPTEGTGSI